MILLEKIRNILVQALSCEPEDINLDTRIVCDLGAESIDFLDISFRLEREFGVKISTNELFKDGSTSEDIKSFTVRDIIDFLVNVKGVECE